MRSTGGAGARFGVCAIAGDERSTSAKAAFFISTSRSAYYIIVLPYCILLTGTVGVHSLVETTRKEYWWPPGVPRGPSQWRASSPTAKSNPPARWLRTPHESRHPHHD